ncbi:MAG: hypothetical protein WAU69_05795 [Solirubrobacteraceae bacterium]
MTSINGRIAEMAEPDLNPTPEDELAIVALAEDFGGWPAGTEGTLVRTYPGEASVEIMDDEGRTLDAPIVPYTLLRVVERHK